jgi:putative endonuclease
MYMVYILYSVTVDRYYVGQSSDIVDRLIRHNQGRNKYTKSGIPWKLVYRESFASRAEAEKRENGKKSQKAERGFKASSVQI